MILGKKGSSKSEKRKIEREQQRQLYYQGLKIRQGEEAKERTLASEQGRLGVMSLLGQPGTYELLPGGPTAAPVPGTPTPVTGTMDPGAIGITSRRATAGLMEKPGLLGPEGTQLQSDLLRPYTGVVKPGAYATDVAKTSDFRIMSRLTAQYEQGLAEAGPLWEAYRETIMGPIIQGAQSAYQESKDAIMLAAAKEGGGRRVALREAQNLIAIESANRTRTEELWKANLAVKEALISGAREQVAMNTLWGQSLPFQQAYLDQINKVSQWLSGTATPLLSGHSASEALAKISSGKKNSYLSEFITGAGTVIGAALAG